MFTRNHFSVCPIVSQLYKTHNKTTFSNWRWNEVFCDFLAWHVYLRTFKRNTWIAALIYVSKKKAKRLFRLYAEVCSIVSNTCKNVRLN